MKRIKIIIALLTLIGSLATQAQNFPAQYLFYQKGANGNWGARLSSEIDSIVYESEDDAFHNLQLEHLSVNNSGDIEITATATTGFTITKVLCTLIASSANLSVTERANLLIQLRKQYLNGQLTGLREMQNNQCTYSIEPGCYRAFAVGMDKDGKLRNVYLSDAVDMMTALKQSLLSYQTSPNVSTTSSNSRSWGYGAIMHMRDLMGEEMIRSTRSGYDHFMGYEEATNLGTEYTYCEPAYLYYHKSIVELNNTIQLCERRQQKSNDLNAILGYAYALRALNYLDFARMYEFLANDAVSGKNQQGNDVTGLTVPIIKSPLSSWDEKVNIPRATRNEMWSFIISDLQKAQELASNTVSSDKTLPSLAVILGLQARAYLWAGLPSNALSCANKAMDTGGYSCIDSKTLKSNPGFNNASACNWMLTMSYHEGDNAVLSMYNNWVSWCTNETNYAYCSSATGMYTCIGKSLYDKISSTDIRKHLFKGEGLDGEDLFYNGITYMSLPAYASLKFHPKDANNYQVAAVVDVPLMRFEEMLFIAAEAKAQLGDVAGAREELVNFMRTYRDPNYTCSLNTKEELTEELFLQKRIEFWGEGINYFDYKRLNHSVTRGYTGTNFFQSAQMNTTTRPAWMNLVIPAAFENNYNTALKGYNNPDPSGCYSTLNY